DGSITWQEITSDGMAFAFVGALPGVCDTCSSTGSNDWLMTRVDAITDSTHVTLHDVATTAVTNKAGARHDDTAAFNACLPVAGIGVSGMISPLVKVSQGFATLKNVQMLYGNGCILTLANHLTLENSACNAAQSQTTLPVLEFDGSYGNLIRRSVISSSGQTLPPAIYFTRGLYGATDFGITHVEDSYLVGG